MDSTIYLSFFPPLQTLGHLEKAVVLELTLKHVKALTSLIEQQQQQIIALQKGLHAGESSDHSVSLKGPWQTAVSGTCPLKCLVSLLITTDNRTVLLVSIELPQGMGLVNFLHLWFVERRHVKLSLALL